MATTDGATDKEEGKPSVRNLRSMWQQRADQSTREKIDQPPPSPSSKASAAINAQSHASFDPFTPYGISFTSDQNKALVVGFILPAARFTGRHPPLSYLFYYTRAWHPPLTLTLFRGPPQLRKVAYGGPADRAGVPLFPGDVLQSIDGIDVHG
jgi:S1-C subfamily serine protease